MLKVKVISGCDRMGRAKQLTFDELESKQSFREVKGPYELPEGWGWIKLKDIVTEDRNQINPQDFPEQEFWLVTMDCVETNTGRLLQRVVVRGKEIKSVKFRFNSEHILYGKLRPYLNKVYAPDGEGICTTEFIPLLPNYGIYRDFLAIYLRTQYVVNYAMKNLTGARQPRVDLNAFFKLPVPIPFKDNKPDIEEQKRIVAKIEELFSKIDRIKELRRRAREEAENLLKAALYHVFSRVDERGWRWVRIKDVVREIKSGFACSKTNEVEEGIPHLRPHNIGLGKIDLSNVVYLPLEMVDLKTYSLKRGDVLFNNTNSKELVGRAALVIEDMECGFSNHITRIRVKKDKILPEFLSYAINHLWMSGYFLKICTKWIGQAGVNNQKLKATKIPLPPLEEQKRIAAYLDKIAEKQRKLLELYEQTEKELEMMKQAILNRAFRGEL